LDLVKGTQKIINGYNDLAAKTFTGLKLQGEIGKFGNIEISDTAGYAMFPDGKVLSGAERGSLLLWEDALVKCEFQRPGAEGATRG
jgi:hypothetical protein